MANNIVPFRSRYDRMFDAITVDDSHELGDYYDTYCADDFDTLDLCIEVARRFAIEVWLRGDLD